jgi:hypothetical protein
VTASSVVPAVASGATGINGLAGSDGAVANKNSPAPTTMIALFMLSSSRIVFFLLISFAFAEGLIKRDRHQLSSCVTQRPMLRRTRFCAAAFCALRCKTGHGCKPRRF